MLLFSAPAEANPPSCTYTNDIPIKLQLVEVVPCQSTGGYNGSGLRNFTDSKQATLDAITRVFSASGIYIDSVITKRWDICLDYELTGLPASVTDFADSNWESFYGDKITTFRDLLTTRKVGTAPDKYFDPGRINVYFTYKLLTSQGGDDG